MAAAKIPAYHKFLRELTVRLVNAGVDYPECFDNDSVARVTVRNLRLASMCTFEAGQSYAKQDCLEGTCNSCGFGWITQFLCPDKTPSLSSVLEIVQNSSDITVSFIFVHGGFSSYHCPLSGDPA